MSLTGGRLRIRKTTNSQVKVCIVQPAPSGDFTAFTKVTHTAALGQSVFAGIWLADPGLPPLGNQYRLGLGITASSYIVGAYRDAGWETFIATMISGAAISPWGPWIRVSRGGTTIYLDYSDDGLSWTNHGSFAYALVGGPLSYIGLGYGHERASAVDVCEFEYFRVVDGVSQAALVSP